MTTVNKSLLIRHVAERMSVPLKDAERAVDTVLAAIADEVDAGNAVRIHGFGKFEQRTRAARTSRNPKTGAPVEVPARRVMAFKASKSAA